MIGVQAAFNDENLAVHQQPGPSGLLKENALQDAKLPGSTIKSARKAFGNITNTQARCDAAAQQPGTVKRRTFGADLTNSAQKPTARGGALLKPSSLSSAHKPSSRVEQPAPAATQPVPAVSAEQQQRPAPSWWATEPPERSAGKTWEQLEADREAAEDAEAELTAQQLVAGLRAMQRASFQAMLFGGSSTLDSEAREELRPMPVVDTLVQPTGTAAAAAAALQAVPEDVSLVLDLGTCLADLLPDVQLPTEVLQPQSSSAEDANASASMMQPCSSSSAAPTAIEAPAFVAAGSSR